MPNFSTTIHSATGRNLKSGILDLGDVGARPSLDAAMRGYIGLSRVRAAHNLLLPQPFSPLLFSQGPQPFPSALMEVLRGNVHCAEVSAKMKEAHVSKKDIKQLKSTRWKCSGCHDLAPTNQYVFGVAEKWYDEVYRLIIRPGKLRRCRRCRPDPDVKIAGHECSACGKVKHRNEYPSSMWHNKTTQKALCFTCFHPPCTCPTCLTCPVCRDPHCEGKQCERGVVPLNSREVPKNQEEVDAFLCVNCRYSCAVCGRKNGTVRFPTSMWHNRHTRPIFCNRCCNPPCTSPACATCQVCRDPHCKEKQCSRDVVPLLSSELPQSQEDVAAFVCLNCRYPCSLCKEKKGKSGFPNSMWVHRYERQILCNQCCNPRCSAQHCSRCRVCRDIHCRKRVCDKHVKPLHPKQFPKSRQEVDTYLCELCRYITCSCGARMPKPMQKRQRLCTGVQTYVCVDCQSRAQLQVGLATGA